MLKVRPLGGAASVAESGFLAGVARVEACRMAGGGVEGVRLEEGALVFGVGEAPKVLRGHCCRPCNSFSASIANWNNLSTVLKSL